MNEKTNLKYLSNTYWNLGTVLDVGNRVKLGKDPTFMNFEPSET